MRLMASGASGGREVRHTMEVLADADGVKPVFRCALLCNASRGPPLLALQTLSPPSVVSVLS